MSKVRNQQASTELMAREPDAARAAGEGVDPYPSTARSNTVLALLLGAYILSFIDRNILAMLVQPIRESFQISDFQFSILHGWAFTIFYVFLGLPIGRLADRYSRRLIIAASVCTWSLMTCACGFARSFGGLFAVRVGVGVGEAGLSPAAYSLMSDYFPPHRLHYATAIYITGTTIGGGLAFAIGGLVYDAFARMDLGGVPILGAMEPWQLTFLAVGLPGVFVSLLFLLVREPPRRGAGALEEQESIPLREVAGFLRKNWQCYLAVLGSLAAMAIAMYGTLTWFPEFLFRTYGLGRAEAGGIFGTIFIVFGTAGALGGARFASWLRDRGYADAGMRVVMLTAAFLVIPGTLLPLMPSSTAAFVLAGPVFFGMYMHTGVAIAAFNLMCPNRMRAQLTALLLFCNNIFGLALGGTFVAGVTDFVYADDGALRYSLSLVSAFGYGSAALIMGWGLKYYRQRLAVMGLLQEAAEQSTESSASAA